MTLRISLLMFPALAAAAVPVHAGELAHSSAKSSIEIADAQSRWRFGAGFAPLIGLKADFTGLGAFNNAFTPQPLGGGTNYDYDNGFVHVDSSGNLGGQTWNWGYDDNAQYDPAGSGSIAFSISNSRADGSAEEDGDLESGFEAFAYYDMGTVSIPALGNRATWGLRGGLHYARISMGNRDASSASVETITDLFDLGGTIPPLAPYSGSFAGPGPLISDSPFDRSTAIDGQALISGARDLDVHLTTLNFGAWLEVPVCPRFQVMLEGGVCAAFASGSYDFQTQTAISGLGNQQSSGHDSGTDILPGLYLGVSGIYQIDESWGVQMAGRYQYMDGFDLESNGSRASLSFDSAFVLSAGLVYSF